MPMFLTHIYLANSLYLELYAYQLNIFLSILCGFVFHLSTIEQYHCINGHKTWRFPEIDTLLLKVYE